MHKIAMLLLPAFLGAAELPVREVVLYKNGVGYFIRAGEAKTAEPVRLEFREAEMNDVLKSLTVSDRGGVVTQLRYDSNEPLDRKLSEFPFALGDKLTLAAFLDQLKGARVEIRFGPETLSGVIISGRNAPAEKDRGERDMLVLLLEGGDLRTVDLAAAQSIRFADPLVQKQLAGFLAVLNQARSKEKRAVYIDGTGSGPRQITASYMVPTPVWKSSYRLLFGEKEKPVLEGWAIVDNTSGDDWSNIRLALVSGRPVSFISHLYDPKYIERQSAELAETASVAPTVHEGAMDRMTVLAAAPMNAPATAGARTVLKRLQGAMSGQATQMVMVNAPPSVDSAEVGDLFEYRFATPVTIKRGESAMLPFLQDAISARRLLIYTGEGLNPLNAAELTNSTGKTLDGGPITVFDGRSYAGEALMETSKAGDKRLISYAVDLGTRITTAFDSASDIIREIYLRRGIMTTRSSQQETRTYTIKNVDQKPKTLVIEHAVRPEYKLLNQKPAETTAHAYRFEVKLAAGASQKFPVTEERVYDTSAAIVSFTPDVLVTFIENKTLSDNGKRQLERIAAKKREIAENDNALRRAGEQSNEVVNDQGRLRQNIDSLNRVSGQQDRVQQYARDLSTSESKLAALRDRRRDLEQKKIQLERELNAQIESADF